MKAASSEDRISTLCHFGRAFRPTIWFVLLWCALFGASAFATTIRLISLEMLTRASSEIVHGKVTDIESFWYGDRRGIYTLVTFRPERVLKGKPPQELVVVLLGGTVGGTKSIIVDAPELHEGEELVLFLTRIAAVPREIRLPSSTTPFRLTNFVQGVFKVTRDKGTGERRAVSHAMSVMDPASVSAELRTTVLSLGGARGLPLTELASRVAEIK
jgi:hypothetical protein